MGIFSKMFSSGGGQGPNDPVHKYFAQQEKLAWKWPSKEYGETLGVYLNGTLQYTDGTKDAHGGFIYRVEALPDKIDRQKAVELCRAAMDPANVRAMKNKFGNHWGDPHYAILLILAVISPDEEERDRCIRGIMRNNPGGLLYSQMSYYLYYHGLLDKYCPSLQDKLSAYYWISNSKKLYCEERTNWQPAGRQLWERDELCCGVDWETRRSQGMNELKKLLQSDDPQTRTAAADFLQNQFKKEQGEFSAKMKEYYDLCQYMQDELDYKFTDQNGDEIVLKNGRVRKTSRS